MRNRGSDRRLTLCALDIDMDPLIIPRSLSKLLNAFLRDLGAIR